MKTLRLLASLGCVAVVAVSLNAQPKTSFRPNETVLLYGETLSADNPDPVVAETVLSAGFVKVNDNDITEPETIIPENGNISKINADARMDLYFPQNPNGQMVVVCPGGGYLNVSSFNEGVYVAEWMCEHGITVAVVKYRLPNGNWNVPLEDTHNAFRYCRAHAEQWGVSQIGVMGFSAGGHLAVSTALLYDDAVTRPDFGVFIYPVVSFEEGVTHIGTHDNLIGKKDEVLSRGDKTWEEWNMEKEFYADLEKTYSLETEVAADNPPAFIALSSDDKTVIPENSLRLYSALISKGVSAEMHIYPKGGHGWGFSSERYVGEGRDWFVYARGEFLTSLDRWLTSLRSQN